MPQWREKKHHGGNAAADQRQIVITGTLDVPTTHLVTIQDYSGSTDTCTVSFDQIGVISTWIDGVQIGSHVPRHYLVQGAQGLIMLPDPHNVCAAILTAVYSTVPATVTNTPTSTTITQAGRGSITVGSTGTGAVTITFSPAFSNIPTVSVLTDGKDPSHLPATITSSSFAVNVSGKTPGSTIFFSWTATGNK